MWCWLLILFLILVLIVIWIIAASSPTSSLEIRPDLEIEDRSPRNIISDYSNHRDVQTEPSIEVHVIASGGEICTTRDAVFEVHSYSLSQGH